VVISLLVSAALAAAPTLAVLDLDNHTGDPSFDAAGPGVAQILVSKFARVDEVVVVERERVADVMDELKLQRTKSIDDKSAVDVGRLLGAKYLVMGQIFSVKLPNVVVSLRIVDVETGQVVVAKDVTGAIGADGSEFFVLIDEVGFEVLDALQIRLDAGDRIEFGQIDVHRLDTVETFGKALKALDAGRNDEAQQLLAQALALEPGFRIAEDELDKIAAAIAAKKTVIAHEAVTRAHAKWDELRTEAIANTRAPAATLTGAAWMALRGRLFLIDGQLAEALAWEERRAVWVRDNWTALIESARTGPGTVYLESRFEGIVYDLLLARSMESHRHGPFGELEILPSTIRMDDAAILVALGREEEAAAALITAYQDPGPLEQPRDTPPDPRRYAENLGLYDLVVVLDRQRVRQAELEGATRDASQRLSDLERSVYEARQAREATKECETLAARLSRESASSDLLWREEKCARIAREAPARALTGYQAFTARVASGYYDAVRTDDRFEDLARQWYDTLSGGVWGEDWFADQRVASLIAYQEQVPTTNPEEKTRREAALRSNVTGWYPK
jgi:TolB-like protein